jgi:hypothetical protein
MEGAHLRLKPSQLRAGLRAYAAHRPDQELTYRAMSEQLRAHPSRHACELAEALLGLTDIPDETWHGPLPPGDGAERALTVAIDRLSTEWPLTDVHRLVALRRVAWAASQLSRVMEKKLSEVVLP